MKPLNVQSEISYNERELQSKSFEQLTLIKIEIEAELDRLFDLLKSVSFMNEKRLNLTNLFISAQCRYGYITYHH